MLALNWFQVILTIVLLGALYALAVAQPIGNYGMYGMGYGMGYGGLYNYYWPYYYGSYGNELQNSPKLREYFSLILNFSI